MGKHAITQTVTTEFVEMELGESLLTAEEEKELLGLMTEETKAAPEKSPVSNKRNK